MTSADARTPAVTHHHNADGMLRIRIDGILHLAFSTRRLAGVQSWTTSRTRKPAKYVIEITPTKGAAVTAEYDDAELWRAVLDAIDSCFGPG